MHKKMYKMIDDLLMSILAGGLILAGAFIASTRYDEYKNGDAPVPYITVYRGNAYDIVYDRETMVMYSVSDTLGNRGVATVMLNADGTPKLWDGETSETN